MSSCQLFFLLFTSQLGKWLFLRTVQRCRLLAFSVVSVTGQSAFWKVDRTLFLHSLQAVAISKSCAIRSFTHSSVGFMVIRAWLGYVDTTDTFAFLKLQIVQLSHFCRLPPSLFPIESDPCCLVFSGAENLNELHLTFDIRIQWIFWFQRMLRNRLLLHL